MTEKNDNSYQPYIPVEEGDFSANYKAGYRDGYVKAFDLSQKETKQGAYSERSEYLKEMYNDQGIDYDNEVDNINDEF